MARPSKIDRFIEVAEKILFKENLMLLTDEEFVFLINQELSEKERISDRTFARWKAKDFEEGDEVGKSFVMLYKKALLHQKENLMKSMIKDDRAWQKYAWIIERKFKEWNLKIITENKNDNTTTHKGEIKINYNVPKDE